MCCADATACVLQGCVSKSVSHSKDFLNIPFDGTQATNSLLSCELSLPI